MSKNSAICLAVKTTFAEIERRFSWILSCSDFLPRSPGSCPGGSHRP